nr:hypothetical protein CFP56_19228 [Quercus suber]
MKQHAPPDGEDSAGCNRSRAPVGAHSGSLVPSCTEGWSVLLCRADGTLKPSDMQMLLVAVAAWVAAKHGTRPAIGTDRTWFAEQIGRNITEIQVTCGTRWDARCRGRGSSKCSILDAESSIVEARSDHSRLLRDLTKSWLEETPPQRAMLAHGTPNALEQDFLERDPRQSNRRLRHRGPKLFEALLRFVSIITPDVFMHE